MYGKERREGRGGIEGGGENDREEGGDDKAS